MTIIYRVSPFKQHNPSPIYSNDKYKLVELAHNSFVKALSGDEKIIYLLDRCPDWSVLFKNNGEIVNYKGTNRSFSIIKMFEMARYLEGKVFFVEDDYLWRPDTIKHIGSALDHFKLVSPYDHPTHYEMNDSYNMKNIDGLVYRDSPSNTHTFATHAEYIREHWKIFEVGMWDHPLFTALPDKIWNPTYSFATHLVENLLAPNTDWEELWKSN